MKYLHILFVSAVLLAVSSCTPSFPTAEQVGDWVLVIQSLDSARTEVHIPGSEAVGPKIRHGRKGTRLTWSSVGGHDIEVSFLYAGKEDNYEVTPSVVNREAGWVVLTLAGPEVRDLGVDVEKMPLLVPSGGGVRYDLTRVEQEDTWKKIKGTSGYEARWSYPGYRISMPWLQFTSGDRSLYIVSYDPDFRWKIFRIQYFPDERRAAFRVENKLTCFPGETWNGAPVKIAWNEGSWKEGAREYRAWYDKVKPLRARPEWIRNASGWLLTILRQQNGEMIWSYPEVGTLLADAADRRGIDILGLYGWTVGGHDRFYPDYDISDEMGGEEALKEALENVHKRGKRAIFYINGQLIDRNDTQFWPDTGQFIARVGKSGAFMTNQYIKFNSKGPRTFGLGCYQDVRWRNRMLSVAKKVQALGADGVIYDQVGGHNGGFCYGEGHGHTVPAIVYDRDRVEFLEWASAEMRKIDPDFVVMAEALQDCELNGIDMFHGWSPTSQKGVHPEVIRHMCDRDQFMTLFPDMFHYVFPEAQATVRFSTPATMRGTLNYGTTFGYRHEIECRYIPDKKYLLYDQYPDPSEYDDIHGKPNNSSIYDYNPTELVGYGRAVLDFRRKYEDLFYLGTFSADDGFMLETDARYVIARSFVNGKRMGVVVWNVSDEESAGFTVTPEKGWKLVETAAPEGTPAEGLLPAQSLRLLVFEKE